jgi:23S rRNA pseudouridine955/2504/2580 synthase
MKSVKINTNDSNQRIDNFLRKSFPKLTLNSIYKYIRMKRIKVNEKRTEEKYILKQGDTVQLYVNDEFLTKNESSKDFLLVPKKLDVVYEDQNIILINKPVGLVVHDDDNNTVDTLTRRLQHYLYDKKE